MSPNENGVTLRPANAPDAPQPSGGYAQCVEVSGAQRMAFVSGQIPVGTDGRVPDAFEAQARLAWSNVVTQLAAVDMGVENIVKHTTFLARRDDRAVNSQVRQEVLGDHPAALTVMIAGIFDEAWLIEIEAVAVA